MLAIEYEQSLVETTVFLTTRANETLECELHLAIDPLYEILDEELRQREFVTVFRDYFAKLKLDHAIGNLIAERPLIARHVDQCIVREAARKKDESAELFVREIKNSGTKYRTLVIQVCPGSLIDSKRLDVQMRRELLHVSDMLDECFDYEYETFSGPLSLQNLQRDRYRVLWDTYVEGRLHREKLGVQKEKSRLQQSFERVFTNCSPTPDERMFHEVFNASSLTHEILIKWAREPDLLFDSLVSAQCTDRISTVSLPSR